MASRQLMTTLSISKTLAKKLKLEALKLDMTLGAYIQYLFDTRSE